MAKWAVVALISLGICEAAVGVAAACGRSLRVVEPDMQKLMGAEEELLVGRANRAFPFAVAAMRSIADASDQALLARAQRALAVATLRLAGGVDMATGRPRPRAGERARADNLRWAVQMLTELALRDPSPLNEARYAEALALTPAGGEQALSLLRRLHREDLVPDAHAYATLARLENALGKQAARDVARELCEQRAGDKAARICPHFDDERDTAEPQPAPEV